MNNQLLLHNGFAALSLWRKWQSVRRRMLWLHKACACLSKEKLCQTDPEAELANDFAVCRNCNFMLMRPCLHWRTKHFRDHRPQRASDNLT